MKSSTLEPSSILALRTIQDGKIQKSWQTNKKDDPEEIQLYLSKLQELVPFIPKNKRLTKLQVIQYVIDYIRELRQTLEIPSCSINALDSLREKIVTTPSSSSSSSTSNNSNNRKVLPSENSNLEPSQSNDISNSTPGDVERLDTCVAGDIFQL